MYCICYKDKIEKFRISKVKFYGNYGLNNLTLIKFIHLKYLYDERYICSYYMTPVWEFYFLSYFKKTNGKQYLTKKKKKKNIFNKTNKKSLYI